MTYKAEKLGDTPSVSPLEGIFYEVSRK